MKTTNTMGKQSMPSLANMGLRNDLWEMILYEESSILNPMKTNSVGFPLESDGNGFCDSLPRRKH